MSIDCSDFGIWRSQGIQNAEAKTHDFILVRFPLPYFQLGAILKQFETGNCTPFVFSKKGLKKKELALMQLPISICFPMAPR